MAVGIIKYMLHEFEAFYIPAPAAIAVAVGVFSLLLVYFMKQISIFSNQSKGPFAKLPRVPVVPGVPVVGNLLQLKEKKPYKQLREWADKYGPIYSIRTGASTVVVLNSTHVAKEAMVTRHSSISTRKTSKTINILSSNKSLVAMSDYNEFHRMAKRLLLTNVLGPNAQKQHRGHRDTMRERVVSRLHAHVNNSSQEAVNFRKIFESELFGIALKQAIGKDVKDSVYVEELGGTLSRDEIFHALVLDIMEGTIEVDWRDFFPYLRWLPNKTFDMKIQRLYFRRKAIMNALINEYKKGIVFRKEINCYVKYLLCEAKTLTMEQIATLVWETIIGTSDTTLVTVEWAMFELCKHPKHQKRLYEEIRSVCGSDKITEEHLSQLPYLNAVFHESLRKHSPFPIIPLRYVHEDTKLGGYYVPAGTQIAINIYGCNMDKNEWESPEEWKPERFLNNEKYDAAADLQWTMNFGAGRRKCVGSLQAMLIARTVIGRTVQEFEWRLGDEKKENGNVDAVMLTNRKLYPLLAHIKPRN